MSLSTAPPAARRAADSARRRTSASVVLRSVLDHGPVARSTIARLTGLSPASVTDHCARLGALGLIREAAAPRQSNGAGRPHIPVDLDASRFVVGGVHVAVPYTTVALLDLRGQVVVERRLGHGDGTEPGRVLANAADGLGALLAEAGDRTPLGIGVAAGGWVDRDSGTIVEHGLLGWRDVAVREAIGAHTGLPVQVDGHARALVNGERLFGRVRGAGAFCTSSSAMWWTPPSPPTTRCTTAPALRPGRSPICRCKAVRSRATAAGPGASKSS